MHGWWWQGANGLNRLHGTRERPYLLAPLAVGLVFLAFTWGRNWPSLAFESTPISLTHELDLGLVPTDPVGRTVDFWSTWGANVAAAAALALIGAGLHLRRVEAWLVLGFVILLTIFLVAGIGRGSFRYLAPVEPLMWLLAAFAARRVVGRLATLTVRMSLPRPAAIKRGALSVAIVSVVVASAAQSSYAAIEGTNQSMELNGPLNRAAAYLASLPQDPALLVVVDSPLIAEASGLSASRMVGSVFLPDTREAALAWMQERVQYVVAVNLSYYKLLRLFPELRGGSSNDNFSLLYNATGWEIQYTVKTAWVYRVNRGEGLVAMTADLGLSFAFSGEDLSLGVTGLRPVHRGIDLAGAAKGIAYPTLATPSGTLRPGRIEAAFATESAPTAFLVTYTLFPEAAGGGLDTSGASATVSATFEVSGYAVEAALAVTGPPSAGPFVLRVNNTVPDSTFPLTFNDSIAEPTNAPHPEVLVWSLQNWLIGDRAVIQVDFRAPFLMYGARERGGTAWLALEATPNATSLTYLLHLIPPGTPLFGEGEPIFLKGPLFRAGGYLAQAPLAQPLRILSDFTSGTYPWVREASGRPEAEFANLSELPSARDAALAWLRANIAYIVAINSSGDPITALFPELAAGAPTREFSLMFDASGPPGSLTERLVRVYRVNGVDGLVPAHEGAAFRFVFEQNEAAAGISGLNLVVNGTDLAAPYGGLGLPYATVNGAPYRAGTATLAFAAGSTRAAVEGTYFLYPFENGSLNLSAPALVLQAEFGYDDLLLSITYRATPPRPTDNVTLTANLSVAGSAFPAQVNDTGGAAETSPVNRTNIWSLRNWLLGPQAALQADFRDPYLLFVERRAGGEASFAYQGPAGDLTLTVSVWVLPPHLAPPP
jgi:hypothetical protein